MASIIFMRSMPLPTPQSLNVQLKSWKLQWKLKNVWQLQPKGLLLLYSVEILTVSTYVLQPPWFSCGQCRCQYHSLSPDVPLLASVVSSCQPRCAASDTSTFWTLAPFRATTRLTGSGHRNDNQRRFWESPALWEI